MRMPDSLKDHLDGEPGMMVGWMDEYIVLLVTIPLALVFIPGFQTQAKQAFEALRAAPDWYADAVFAALAASVGTTIIRGVRLPIVLTTSPPFVRPAAAVA